MINNTASSFAPAPLAELDVSIYDETMAVGARAAYLTDVADVVALLVGPDARWHPRWSPQRWRRRLGS